MISEESESRRRGQLARRSSRSGLQPEVRRCCQRSFGGYSQRVVSEEEEESRVRRPVVRGR